MSDEVRYAVEGDGPLPAYHCPRCGEINAPRAVECSVCGAELPELIVVNDGDPSKWVGWGDAAPELESEEEAADEEDEESENEEGDEDFSDDELIEEEAPIERAVRYVSDDLDAKSRRLFPWKAIASGLVVLGLAWTALRPLHEASDMVVVNENAAPTGGSPQEPDDAPPLKSAPKTHFHDSAPASGNTASGAETSGGPVLTLSDAALIGDVDGLKNLLTAGADVDEKDKKGWTPLMNAAAGGKDEAAKLLLEHKADANITSPEGDSAVVLAATFGSASCIRLLADAGADLNAPNGKADTPLLCAAAPGHSEAVQALLKAGADPNKARDDNGYTPLMAAASNGHADAVKSLLAAKADANATFKNGDTALKMATTAGHDDVAQLLKEAGAK